MADSTLRLSPPQPSDFIFQIPSLFSPSSWRFQSPRILPRRPHLVLFSSSHASTSVLFVPEKINRPTRRRTGNRSGATAPDEGNYTGNGGWRERRKRRRRKRRRSLEELLEDDNGNGDDDDDEDDDGGVAGIFDQVIDNVWIFKVFKSYGYLLPFIILSFFITTGPKAFLTALAVAAAPSPLFLAFQMLTGGDKRRKKLQTNNFRSEEEEEEEETRRRVGYNRTWVRRSNGSPAEASRGVKSGSNEHSHRGETSGFGGWDELDGSVPIPEPSSPVTNESAKKPAGNGKKFGTKRVKRERAEPLLLRSLVSLFPFLR